MDPKIAQFFNKGLWEGENHEIIYSRNEAFAAYDNRMKYDGSRFVSQICRIFPKK